MDIYQSIGADLNTYQHDTFTISNVILFYILNVMFNWSDHHNIGS